MIPKILGREVGGELWQLALNAYERGQATIGQARRAFPWGALYDFLLGCVCIAELIGLGAGASWAHLGNTPPWLKTVVPLFLFLGAPGCFARSISAVTRFYPWGARVRALWFRFFPQIERPNAFGGAALLFLLLMWAASHWRDWALLFQYGSASDIAIRVLIAAAAVAGCLWCCLLVGRAYGGGFLRGVGLSGRCLLMWFGVIGFAMLSVLILIVVVESRLRGVAVSPIPLAVPGAEAAFVAMWWLGRLLFLRAVQLTVRQ